MNTSQPALVISEDLLPGDLLFQLRRGGEIELVTSRLFAGRDGMAVNYVAIYEGDGMVIEAMTPQVQKTSLDEFIGLAVRDNHSHPCVFVCRLEAEYSAVVPKALEFVQQQIAPCRSGMNDEARQKSWYCSELIVQAFRHNGEPLFEQTPTSFHGKETGVLTSLLGQRHQEVGKEPAEGLSHPALLSRSEKLVTVNVLGSLPARSGQNLCALKPDSTLA